MADLDNKKVIRINKTAKLGKLCINFSYRNKYNFLGRFGGGWNWKLGIQIGGNTILLSLLICEVTISI